MEASTILQGTALIDRTASLMTPTEMKLIAMAEGAQYRLFSVKNQIHLLKIAQIQPLEEFKQLERGTLLHRTISRLVLSPSLASDMLHHHREYTFDAISSIGNTTRVHT